MSSFVGDFFRNPATVGALIPSSRELTDKVTEPIAFDSATCIVEYGPGPGVFTDILIQRRRPETVLMLVEVNRRFAQLLRERYAGQPNVHVVHGSAKKLFRKSEIPLKRSYRAQSKHLARIVVFGLATSAREMLRQAQHDGQSGLPKRLLSEKEK